MENKIIELLNREPFEVNVVRFGNEFLDGLLLENENKEVVRNELKIVFNIISQLKNGNYKTYNEPLLFDDDTSSIYTKIKIKNNLITEDSDLLEKAYKFLENYKKGWYKLTTSEGREIEFYGGLVSSIVSEENGYTTFLISDYWVERLIEISNNLILDIL